MGITFGDYLIDSGYYEPEEESMPVEPPRNDLLERMEEEWLSLSRKSFDGPEYGIAANVCQEAMDEIRRLREVKTRALQIADERSKENADLKARLALETKP